MALKGCPACIKYVVFAFNLLFWLIGLGMVAMGTWALIDDRVVELLGKDTKFVQMLTAGAIVIIAVGAVVMITGFFGCCGAIRESQCCLALFFLVLLILFLILTAIGTLVLIGISTKSVQDQFRKVLKTTYKENVDKFNALSSKEKISYSSLLTLVEKLLKCCGESSASDYITGTSILEGTEKSVSCSKNAFEDGSFPKGCTAASIEALKTHGVVVGGVALGAGVLVLIGMIFACTLCCAIRRNREYVDDY